MDPAIRLETGRLLLRPFVVDDAADFYRLNSDPEVVRYTGDHPPASVEAARLGLIERPLADYQRYGFGRLACVLKATGEFIGFAGLKFLPELNEVDLGYRFLRAFWGQGLATEAARASLADGFGRLGLRRIVGLVEREHRASVRVLEKCGMTFERMVDYRGTNVAQYAVSDGRSAVCNGTGGEVI